MQYFCPPFTLDYVIYLQSWFKILMICEECRNSKRISFSNNVMICLSYINCVRLVQNSLFYSDYCSAPTWVSIWSYNLIKTLNVNVKLYTNKTQRKVFLFEDNFLILEMFFFKLKTSYLGQSLTLWALGFCKNSDFSVEKDSPIRKLWSYQGWGAHFCRHRTLRGLNVGTPKCFSSKFCVKYFL